MKKMLNELIFKDRLPLEYYLSWPKNPDDDYLVVFVRWEELEPFEPVVLRIDLHSA